MDHDPLGQRGADHARRPAPELLELGRREHEEVQGASFPGERPSGSADALGRGQAGFGDDEQIEVAARVLRSARRGAEEDHLPHVEGQRQTRTDPPEAVEELPRERGERSGLRSDRIHEESLGDRGGRVKEQAPKSNLRGIVAILDVTEIAHRLAEIVGVGRLEEARALLPEERPYRAPELAAWLLRIGS